MSLCPPLEKDTNAHHMSTALKSNFEALKKKTLDEESANRLAEETARLVQSEIQHMRNSVMELEAMLAANEEDAESMDEEEVDDTGKNMFPLLPAVVAFPNVNVIGESEEEYGEEDSGEDGDQSDLEN